MNVSPHFTDGEFACRCGCGLGRNPGDVSPDLLAHLETMRYLLDRPMHITSGLRCASHNVAVAGATNSPHMRGAAGDVAISTGRDRWELVAAHVLACAVGAAALSPAVAAEVFGRIRHMSRGLGVARGFVHVDTDRVAYRPAAWIY